MEATLPDRHLYSLALKQSASRSFLLRTILMIGLKARCTVSPHLLKVIPLNLFTGLIHSGTLSQILDNKGLKFCFLSLISANRSSLALEQI
jgi:hypothetical protein